MSLKLFLYFCFSSSKHNISLLLKYISVEVISIKLPLENKSKNRKNKKNCIVQKSYSTSCKGIGDHKKMEKIVKVKPQHWHILIIWKRRNKIKAVKTGVTLKVLCHCQSQNLEPLHSVLKILSFWNRFWIILCLLW